MTYLFWLVSFVWLELSVIFSPMIESGRISYGRVDAPARYTLEGVRRISGGKSTILSFRSIRAAQQQRREHGWWTE